MAREVFEDPDVAGVLNENFVSIKVDREENPDVDDFYINALSLLSEGRAGWPANLFLTPDLKPFFGFTYLPKKNFIEVCKRILKVWKEDRDKIIEYADEVYEKLTTNYLNKLEPLDKSLFSPQKIEEKLSWFDENIYNSLDDKGGFGRRPKFPPHQILEYLLLRYSYAPNDYVFQILNKTLTHMIMGGMYDVVDGGFCRYSVDENWMVPHFEKMLYDNAFLIYIYSKASKIFEKTDNNKSIIFYNVALKTFDFLNNFLYEGRGYYSSLSAESKVNESKVNDKNIAKDEEGAYYLYDYSEIEKINSFDNFFSTYEFYNFHTDYKGLIVHYKKFPSVENMDQMEEVVKKLKIIRKQRNKPYLDNKIVLSWNSILSVYLFKSFKETGYKPFFDRAKQVTDFLVSNFQVNGKLKRLMVEEHVYGKALLEDYLWLCNSLWYCYILTNEKYYYDLCLNLFNEAMEKFYRNGVFYNSENFDIFDIFDNAIHSNNSLALTVGLMLGKENLFTDLALKMLYFLDNFLYLGSYLSFLLSFLVHYNFRNS
ncbi:MAG: thioredoxin domain-containing protein, partial [bacterium]